MSDGLHTSGPRAKFSLEYEITIKSGCYRSRFICTASASKSETERPGCSQLTHTGLLTAPDGSSEIRANRQGTGFVVNEGVGSPVLLDFSAAVGGPVTSLRVAAEGLFWYQPIASTQTPQYCLPLVTSSYNPMGQ